MIPAVHITRHAEHDTVCIADLDEGSVPYAPSSLPAVSERPRCGARPVGLLTPTRARTREGVERRVRWVRIDRGIVLTNGVGERLEVEALASDMIDDLEVVGVTGCA